MRHTPDQGRGRCPPVIKVGDVHLQQKNYFGKSVKVGGVHLHAAKSSLLGSHKKWRWKNQLTWPYFSTRLPSSQTFPDLDWLTLTKAWLLSVLSGLLSVLLLLLSLSFVLFVLFHTFIMIDWLTLTKAQKATSTICHYHHRHHHHHCHHCHLGHLGHHHRHHHRRHHHHRYHHYHPWVKTRIKTFEEAVDFCETLKKTFFANLNCSRWALMNFINLRTDTISSSNLIKPTKQGGTTWQKSDNASSVAKGIIFHPLDSGAIVSTKTFPFLVCFSHVTCHMFVYLLFSYSP